MANRPSPIFLTTRQLEHAIEGMGLRIFSLRNGHAEGPFLAAADRATATDYRRAIRTFNLLREGLDRAYRSMERRRKHVEPGVPMRDRKKRRF